MAPKIYFQSTHIPGLWIHKWHPILFSLVIDDFGVKYVGKGNSEQLISSIRKFYPVPEDWTGSLYCGITLKWYCQKRTVDISIPGYVAAALYKYQHKPAQRPQHSPHKWERPSYEARQKMARKEDTPPLITKEDKTHIQKNCGHINILCQGSETQNDGNIRINFCEPS